MECMLLSEHYLHVTISLYVCVLVCIGCELRVMIPLELTIYSIIVVVLQRMYAFCGSTAMQKICTPTHAQICWHALDAIIRCG